MRYIVVEVYDRLDRQTVTVRSMQTDIRREIDLARNFNIRFGDFIWPGKGCVYWTPADGQRRDIPVPQLGNTRIAPKV